MNRRKLLSVTGTAVSMAIVGCIGSDLGSVTDGDNIPEDEVGDEEDEAWDEFERGVRRGKGDEEFGNEEYQEGVDSFNRFIDEYDRISNSVESTPASDAYFEAMIAAGESGIEVIEEELLDGGWHHRDHYPYRVFPLAADMDEAVEALEDAEDLQDTITRWPADIRELSPITEEQHTTNQELGAELGETLEDAYAMTEDRWEITIDVLYLYFSETNERDAIVEKAGKEYATHVENGLNLSIYMFFHGDDGDVEYNYYVTEELAIEYNEGDLTLEEYVEEIKSNIL